MGELDIYISNGNGKILLDKKRNRKGLTSCDLRHKPMTVLRRNLPLWAGYTLNILYEQFF